MTKRALFWVGTVLLLTAGVVRADDPVTLQADGSFAGMAPRGGVYPVVVSLHNTGPSADGALIVKSESFSDTLRTYAYPVSLPTGTDKQIVVYPAVPRYADKIDVSFDGSARAKDIALPVVDRDGQQVGMVGDEIGALAALRLAPPQAGTPRDAAGRRLAQARYNDCYARPEAAPDRAAGYQSVSTLVLGPGAERLRPEQWAAIRHWVLDGGSLVLTGGAGATYLRVPDAAPLLPIVGVQDASLPTLALPAKIVRQSLPGGPVALVTGTAKPGATVLASQNGRVTLARQSLGAGTVLLVGFNPLEAPFRGWAGQHDLWQGLVRQAAAAVPAWNLRQWTTAQASFDEDETNGYSPGAPRPYSGVVQAGSGVNPFRIKLPPLTTIAWLFLAYFVLVIPVTYTVLKRMKRLEWAWVTSPLLSLAFAYIFYLFTAQLYQAGLSRRTAGVVVAAAGDPDAQFDGFSEMFFPHGGGYRIAIPGTEALELSPFGGGEGYGGYYSSYGRSGSGASLQPLETVDIGDVRAPDLQMGNLAFRRLYHTESVGLGGAVAAALTSGPDGGLRGTLRNGTAQTLTDCGIFQPAAGRYTRIGDLAPGATKTLDGAGGVTGGPGDVGTTPFAGLPVAGLKASGPGPAFLVARTGGERFGPMLGRDVGGPQSVALLVSLPVTPQGGKP